MTLRYLRISQTIRFWPGHTTSVIRSKTEHRSVGRWGSLIRALGGAVGLSMAATAAHAWGAQGHQVVALIAQAQLSSKARAEVDRLLAEEPGQTLETVSTWADEHSNPTTSHWHYVNFARGNCVYDEQRDCPDGRCVVAAIRREVAILGSKAPDHAKLTALKYVVHFVGDVHQPLHAGFQDDKGGNTYQIQAFMRGSNLHAFWDTGLIRNLNEDSQAMAARLPKLTNGIPVSDLDPVTAAQESCNLASLKGFYPSRLVDQSYIERYTPVMERRLATAGARLAGILNATFR